MATILSTREQAIARLTINRPDKLNALDYATIDRLQDALDQVEADPDIPKSACSPRRPTWPLALSAMPPAR